MGKFDMYINIKNLQGRELSDGKYVVNGDGYVPINKHFDQESHKLA